MKIHLHVMLIFCHLFQVTSSIPNIQYYPFACDSHLTRIHSLVHNLQVMEAVIVADEMWQVLVRMQAEDLIYEQHLDV